MGDDELYFYMNMMKKMKKKKPKDKEEKKQNKRKKEKELNQYTKLNHCIFSNLLGFYCYKALHRYNNLINIGNMFGFFNM